MQVRPIEYAVIFLSILIAVVITYLIISFFLKFLKWLFCKISDVFHRKEDIKYFKEKRSINRRVTERRIFNRGFFVKKGFFDKDAFSEELKNQDFIDRRKEERRKSKRRSDK
jgi:hypothetical protein